MRPIDRYHCEETFRRLDDYMDRELTPEEMELIREHLDHCERCSKELKFEETVLREVRAKVTRIPVPSSLMSRISRALSEAGTDEKDP